MGGISVGKLLILGCIVALIFGTKKLRTIGEDAGYAIRSFQKALRSDEVTTQSSTTEESVDSFSFAIEQEASHSSDSQRHS
ncbi:twin-arginine translocase TatA/TatE family subunit [Vibrio cholerae]|uniref:twin-arginine translocase TatA/TatE family subunit n=1 Tax=Vibrio cholerae TaxID=666 RepID=UPI0002A1D61C|nr:twin-arginine translocase TatA/TatE family subunit [Vibrio cholerae]AWB72311.1 Sec-independent protein translocase protein TatA [Vibrio cholerae]EGQ8411256.1 twin-arginine translocase TatA/TatE family subunit [Vibrio cholerae]EIC2298101.1 twin-arginine translocase TatA/TatE family subunit [Vibrio cholerae]EJK2415989.1 twin-arginine translocase TatA/TatE family subunit [Vibrio cholerae]EJL6585746.1 twin-arginine translocase TatA/TatE family subunit [Vibrio cholerae]